jgi:hypothetical protein
MQRLIASDSPRHFMVPLPPGIPEDAAKLFGFYSYEFRTCHDLGWSTAQGRFSAALRVTGVQHSAPPLTCMVLRNKAGILASAPFATPVVDGRSIRPLPPATKIYVMIYAQVTQCDDADRRNVLLSHKPQVSRASRWRTRICATRNTATPLGRQTEDMYKIARQIPSDTPAGGGAGC